MITRSQKIRLGVFVAIGVTLLLAMIVIIVMPKFLEKQDIYYIGYSDLSLTGLQNGSPVKYHGLTVGTVSDIFIDPKDIQRVIVEVSLEPGTPIKEDTYADITILGITGLKLIELRGGTNLAQPLKPGDFMRTGKSVSDLITGKAEIIAEKAEIIMNDLADFTREENRDKIIRFVDNASNSLEEAHSILISNKATFQRTLSNTEILTEDLHEFTVSAEATMANLEKVTGSDSLTQILGNLAEISEVLARSDLTGMVEELTAIMYHTQNVLKQMDVAITRNQSEITQSVQALRESSEYLNQFSRMISEDPSILLRGAKPVNIPDHSLEK